MLTHALATLVSLAVPAHTSSAGKSLFVLDQEGRVELTIVLSDADLPDLCNVDLSLPDRGTQEQRLTRCLVRDLPLLLRLKGDGRPCKLVHERFDDDKGQVALHARADCGALPRVFTVEWGLFAGTPLDHVNAARVEQPWGEPIPALLSKRTPRATFEVSPHPFPRIAAIALVLVVVGAAVAFVMARRPRRGTMGAPPVPGKD